MELTPVDKYFIAFIKAYAEDRAISIYCECTDRGSEYEQYTLRIDGLYIGCTSFDNDELKEHGNEETTKDMVLVQFMYEILRKLF